MMRLRQTRDIPPREQGIALPFVMIILLLAGLAMLYTARTSIKEQEVTIDQNRSEEAFEAAQAGVEAALALHNSFNRDTNNVAPNNIVSPDPSEDPPDPDDVVYTVMFCDIWDEGDDAPDVDTNGDGITSDGLLAAFVRDTYPPGCANLLTAESYGDGFANDARVGIISVGKSKDSSGMRIITAVSAPGLNLNNGGFDFVPLSAKGSVSITGNITVINRYSNINVWSGKNTGSGSNSVESYIRDPDYQVEDLEREELINSDYPDPPFATLASRQDLGKNMDILDGDQNLQDLTPEEMFTSLFSADMDVIEAMARGIDRHYTKDNYTNPANPIQDKTGLLWFEYSGNAPVSFDVGTFDNAAFLIVEVTDGGVFTMNGGTVHGMVFVIGDAQLGGNVVIKGSMIGTGDVDKSGGTPIIVYDPNGLSLDPEGLGGLRGLEPGTWKDWRWDGT